MRCDAGVSFVYTYHSFLSSILLLFMFCFCFVYTLFFLLFLFGDAYDDDDDYIVCMGYEKNELYR